MRQRIAAGDQQFERVVDAAWPCPTGPRAVSAATSSRGIVAEQFRGQRTAPRPHPIDVCLRTVLPNLAVMREIASKGGPNARTERYWSRSAVMPAPAPTSRSAGCAGRHRNSRPAAPTATPCTPPSASKKRRHVEFEKPEPGRSPFFRQFAKTVQRLFADDENLALERVLIDQRRIGQHDRLPDRRAWFRSRACPARSGPWGHRANRTACNLRRRCNARSAGSPGNSRRSVVARQGSTTTSPRRSGPAPAG